MTRHSSSITRSRALAPGTVAATIWDVGQVHEREQLVPVHAWFTTSAAATASSRAKLNVTASL